MHLTRSLLLSSLVCLPLLGAAMSGCAADSGDSGGSSGAAGDSGAAGTSAGAAGSGGTAAGTAGASAGTAGASAGTAGASAGSAGASAGSAGASAGTAGTAGASAGTAGASAGTAGASAGSGGSTMTGALVLVGPGAKTIAEGSEVFDFTTDGVPPFSSATVTIGLQNPTATPMKIDTVAVTPTTALTDEWRVSKPGATAFTPLDLAGATIPAMSSVSLGAYFVPYASGDRQAKFTVTYDGNKAASWTMKGRGRDNATFSPNLSIVRDDIYGDPQHDGLTGGSVRDTAGVVYATANVTQWLDNFTNDIALFGVKPDGTLKWAKVWNEPFDQRQPDPGQNSESGGAADSLALGSDGMLYFAGRRSLNNSNSIYQTLVVKVDPADGHVVWARGFTMNVDADPKVAKDGSQGYAVDARIPDRVIVTGQAEDSQKMLVLGLDKASGNLLFDQAVDLAPGSNDRGHALVTDGVSAGYVGGITNGTGALVRLTGLDGATPKIAWAKRLELGVGSNVNSLDLDAASGDALLSLDRRGATTFLSAARVSTAGAVVWAKTWDANNTGDNDNTYVVRSAGDKVWIGGRMATKPFDTQYGEGFLLQLAASNGAYGFSSFYYTGKGAEEMVEHRVKGIHPYAGGVDVLLQSYTNSLDFEHYWGFWYQGIDETLVLPGGDGSMRLVDYALVANDVAAATIADIPNGTLHTIDTAMIWKAPQAEAVVGPTKERKGGGGDGSMVVQRLSVK